MKIYKKVLMIKLILLSIVSTQIVAEENIQSTNLIGIESTTSSLSGRQILDEVSTRHDQQYEFEIQEMTLVDRSGNQEQREMHRYKREEDDNESRYVSVFLAPSGIKGVSLLTWQHKDRADDQWIYLPAYGKKMKRIAKGGRRNYFMGTDYTFEDLVSEPHEKFAYQRLADEELNGVTMFVVKAMATDEVLKKETAYSFRQLWITQDAFMVARVDFFDKRKRLIKRQLNFDAVNIKGQVWRSNRTEMEHFANQHKTITVVRNRKFDSSAVPEKKFKERAVINGVLVR